MNKPPAPVLMSHSCASWGRSFQAKRSDAVTCSGACRKRRFDARRAALIADLSAFAHEAAAVKLAA